MSSREWYSLQNKVLGKVFQTFREMRLGVIFTTPSISFIDIQARKLFHHYMQTKYIDRENNLSYLRIREINEDDDSGKVRYTYPRLYDKGGKAYRIVSLGVPKPSYKLCKEYEAYHKVFKKKIRQDGLKQLRGEQIEDESSNQDELVADILQRHKNYKRGKQWI